MTISMTAATTTTKSRRLVTPVAEEEMAAASKARLFAYGLRAVGKCCGMSAHRVRMAAKRKELDMASLHSVVNFIAKRGGTTTTIITTHTP